MILAVGTGDTFTWQTFEANYKRMIEYALQHNVVPVLMTKADALEFQQGKAPLDAINLRLERMRHLLRLALGAKACPFNAFESSMRALDEVGRMLHGWREAASAAKAPA